MRGFLQTSPTNMNEKIANAYLSFDDINTSHLLDFRASEIMEQISSDTLAKRIT